MPWTGCINPMDWWPVVHGGLRAAATELTGAHTLSHSGGRELAVSWEKGRGHAGNPHRGRQWPARRRGEARGGGE
jgi:hypothetical protein